MSLRRHSCRRFLSITIISISACAPILSSFAPLTITVSGQLKPEARAGQPERGKPAGTFENIDTLKQRPNLEGRVIDAEPSTIRSPKVPLEPRNGRKVGDAWSVQQIGSSGSIADKNEIAQAQVLRSTREIGAKGERRGVRSRRHHPAGPVPPPLLDHDYVQTFFQQALGRAPSSNELTYWTDTLRAAYANGQGSVALATREMGKTLFESAEYAVRNPNDGSSGPNCSSSPTNNCQYVYHLYQSYLRRPPDQPSWDNWASVVPTYGREHVRRGFDESSEFLNLMATVTPNGSATSAVSSLMTARVEPANQPGSGLVGRSGEWTVSLLRLPGRGLDLGLTLSYSSQVWTRSGTNIYFDEDTGFPSPGFRLGFPTIQEKFFDAKVGRNVYVVITSAGSRVELRQIGTSSVYEAGDSSYLQLTDTGGVLSMRSADGTQFSYGFHNREYRCTQIKDRNGNYITISYDWLGHITTISDTLNRSVIFEYDSNNNLIYIKQQRSAGLFTWASFSWDTILIQPNLTGVSGIANGVTIPVLKKVGLADSSYFKFTYASANTGQVSRITRYGSDSNPATDSHPLTYTTFNYGATDDATRLTSTRLWAENWTGLFDVPSELVTEYRANADGSYEIETPDARVYREFYGTGWKKGFVVRTELLADGTTQLDKWTTTDFTQDNTGLSYPSNPRVTETNVYDSSNNRRRTTISYNSVTVGSTSVHLPEMIREYGGVNGDNLMRRTVQLYRWDQAFMDRRIIGLVQRHEVYHGETMNTLVSMEEYAYDWVAGYMQATAPAVNHDTANYGSSFGLGRGILVAVFRYNINNTSQGIWTQTFGYNLAGQTTYLGDALNHLTNISYADSNGGSTLAYPTTVTDPDGFTSTSEYNYETGAVTKTLTPSKGTGQAGDPVQYLDQRMLYDSVGRLQQMTTQNNGAYVRYVYGSNYVQSYATVNNITDEAYSIQYVTGAGQPFHSASNHPNSTGQYKAQLVYYDKMGRAQKTSNPGEIYASWAPAGDDVAGWLYTTQTYDWQGRPLRTTHPDDTYREAVYSGCGCAGGEVVTLTDEGTIDAGITKRRQQKIYSDVLGRTVKTEVLNWQGGSVYSTTLNQMNARDQVTSSKVYQGPATTDGSCPTGTCQETVTTYDGFARVKTRHLPQQDAGTITEWDYNSDNTIHKITDARGSSQTISYNARHLITGISYAAPSPIITPASISYSYDAAGNRTSMTDEIGTANYGYDQLSHLTSESRTFDTIGPLGLTYEYNLAGQLRKITDPTLMTISYSYDQIGHNTAITGENSLYGGVSQYAQNLSYRAWGALKAMTYGNNYTLTESFNARLLPSQFEVTKPPAQGSTAVMKTQYHYYADASLKFADRVTTLGQGFDRAFSYDQVSMLKEAYSGGEARDYANGTTGGGPGPYRQTYQHNVFGNLTSRDSRYWDHDDLFSATYVNNRSQDPAWQFDADGRLKQDGALQYNYDAAGISRSIYNPSINSTTTLLADGDGRQVKRVDAPPGITVTTYYLRSSVLGGRIVAELGAAGQKHRGYVFAGNEVLALQEFGSVTWKHVDPLTGSAAQTKQNGTFTATAELDPSGVNIGVTNPFISPPQFSPEPFFPMLVGDEGSCGSNPNCVRCYFHGSEIPCGLAGHMGSFTKLDPNVASPTTAQRIGWQPIYFDFCLEEPIGAVGGDPQIPAQERTARPCTPQLTGYSEISLGMNLTPIPQNPRPRFDDSLGPPPPIPALNVGLIATVTIGATCGVNPVTGQPGFTRNPMGQPGHLRASIGGDGWFGARRSGNRPPYHVGIDIAGVLNITPVVAFLAGTVTFAGHTPGKGGTLVNIDHGGGLTSSYVHLQRGSIPAGVGAGQSVTEGQQIGILGNSGNAGGTPPHLHFWIKLNGSPQNPETFLNQPCPP